MKKEFVLTVSESKRLIARGVTNLPLVKKALHEGIVAIAKGSTNSYIVEEILGKKIEKIKYTTGITIPAKRTDIENLRRETLPDVVFRNGVPLFDLPVTEAIKEMRAGDVFIKGGNALNYERKLVGILIGSPTGGTIGATFGRISGQGINLVIPIGLEKCIPADILEIHRLTLLERTAEDQILTLFPITGYIVTEIEALSVLTGVQAYSLAAGGIVGAEGSIRLLVEGLPEQLEKTQRLLEEIQGEPPFIPSS